MSYTTYILYSKTINKYYIGYTSMKIKDRLQRHQSNHKGFTGRATDWEIVYTNSFEEKPAAITLERKIKKRGAERFLKALLEG